ncbi:alpha/beta hydrolase [Kushneria marisflavi]|uniref:Alpha/beta hydrolase n=1 Tax=Kushneria marisflavi TaxID=157779 RepID=A0A240UP99_9GAMM|nr:alpha/beta hydrolase [Kushneria marisflavi]ART62945.1 alpha/beta hydrolase [Kushneria marisflavi]RKD84830.1 alpha-beta hydrolase superfamily lysophospholipase [Kushneria marisflavi]
MTMSLPDFSDLLEAGPLAPLPLPPTGLMAQYFRHYELDALITQVGGIESGHLQIGEFRLWTQVWTPHNALRGTVMVVHGYFDHLGLYGHLLNLLLDGGFRVVLWDLPGHGLSSGERAAIDDFATYTQCLRGLLDQLGDRGLIHEPLIGIGQSTGAAILTTDALERADHHPWQALALLAPLVRPCKWHRSRLMHRLATPFIRSIPRHYRPNTTNLAFTAFLHQKDPLQTNTLPLVWVSAMRDWMGHVRRLPPCHLPVLILQGQQDATVDWRWNLEVLRRLLPAARIVYHQDARHHLVNESPDIRQTLFRDLHQFLITQTEGSCISTADMPEAPS